MNGEGHCKPGARGGLGTGRQHGPELSYNGRVGELAVGRRERSADRKTKRECEGARVLVN